MKKKLLALLLALLSVAFAFHALADGYEDVRNSVVRVYAEAEYYICDQDKKVLTDESGDPAMVILASTGSGFAVGEKGKPVQYIVTNCHVVTSEVETVDEYILVPNPDKNPSVFVLTDDLESRHPVAIAAISESPDLAVLRLNTPITDRVPCALRPFKTLGSEEVYSLGFPGGADIFTDPSDIDYLSRPEHVTIRKGMISRVLDQAETQDGEMIQHDAAINPGNSGGPLVDRNGNVLGVNTYYINGAEGIFSSVSSNEVIRLLDSKGIPYMIKPDNGILDLLKDHLALIIVVAAALVAAVLIIGQLIHPIPPKPNKIQYRVEILSGALAGKSFPLTDTLAIGRDPKKSQIVYPGDTPKVSHVHCTLRLTPQGVMITDNNSTVGTFIEGKKIPAGTPVRLHRGQKVYLGSSAQTFVLRG